MEIEYELKLSNGKTVRWPGSDGMDAAKRYTDTFRGMVVIAWRPVAHGLFIYNHNIPILSV